jgi:hypothetical protein
MFQKGVSGNPGGRPKMAQSVRDLARQHTELAIETLVKAAKRGSITASIALLDRGWGKCEQNIDVTFKAVFERKLNELTEAELHSVREKLVAMNATQPAVIEHHKPDDEM